jgi:hypothetical protein
LRNYLTKYYFWNIIETISFRFVASHFGAKQLNRTLIKNTVENHFGAEQLKKKTNAHNVALVASHAMCLGTA